MLFVVLRGGDSHEGRKGVGEISVYRGSLMLFLPAYSISKRSVWQAFLFCFVIVMPGIA